MNDFLKDQIENEKERAWNKCGAETPVNKGGLVASQQNQYNSQSQNKTELLTDKMFKNVPESEFYKNLCVPADREKFDKKYRWRDQLLITPGQSVSGKGLEYRLRTCYIYLKQGQVRYTFGLGEDDENRNILYKIPKGVALDVIGKGEEIFVIVPENNRSLSIYKLLDDVDVDIYFETELSEGNRNQFYGHISRELRWNFHICNITADPRSGEASCIFFMKTIDLD